MYRQLPQLFDVSFCCPPGAHVVLPLFHTSSATTAFCAMDGLPFQKLLADKSRKEIKDDHVITTVMAFPHLSPKGRFGQTVEGTGVERGGGGVGYVTMSTTTADEYVALAAPYVIAKGKRESRIPGMRITSVTAITGSDADRVAAAKARLMLEEPVLYGRARDNARLAAAAQIADSEQRSATVAAENFRAKLFVAAIIGVLGAPHWRVNANFRRLEVLFRVAFDDGGAVEARGGLKVSLSEATAMLVGLNEGMNVDDVATKLLNAVVVVSPGFVVMTNFNGEDLIVQDTGRVTFVQRSNTSPLPHTAAFVNTAIAALQARPVATMAVPETTSLAQSRATTNFDELLDAIVPPSKKFRVENAPADTGVAAAATASVTGAGPVLASPAEVYAETLENSEAAATDAAFASIFQGEVDGSQGPA